MDRHRNYQSYYREVVDAEADLERVVKAGYAKEIRSPGEYVRRFPQENLQRHDKEDPTGSRNAPQRSEWQDGIA